MLAGNGLRVKTQRVKTSEDFSEESNLPRRFREDISRNTIKIPVKVRSEKSSEISSANICFFREVFRSFCPLRFYPLDLSELVAVVSQNALVFFLWGIEQLFGCCFVPPSR